jgi:hypothetical protein
MPRSGDVSGCPRVRYAVGWDDRAVTVAQTFMDDTGGVLAVSPSSKLTVTGLLSTTVDRRARWLMLENLRPAVGAQGTLAQRPVAAVPAATD